MKKESSKHIYRKPWFVKKNATTKTPLKKIFFHAPYKVRAELIKMFDIGERFGIVAWKNALVEKPILRLTEKIFTDLFKQSDTCSSHFENKDAYLNNVVKPVMERYTRLKAIDDKNMQKKAGIDFHNRVQSVIIGCETLLDIITVAFGPKLLGEMHKVSSGLQKVLKSNKIVGLKLNRDTSSYNCLEFDMMAKEDAIQFISSCAHALGLSHLCRESNASWVKFAEETKVVCVIECNTEHGSTLGNYIHRRPDIVIYAAHPDQSFVVWQCIIELKTETTCRRKLMIQRYFRKGLRNAALGFDYFHWTPINKTYVEKALFQAVDTLVCVNGNVKRYSTNTKVMVNTNAFVWYGFKSALKPRRPTITIFASQSCPIPEFHRRFEIGPDIWKPTGYVHSKFSRAITNVLRRSNKTLQTSDKRPSSGWFS